MLKDTLIKIIVTCFFVGKIKYAPGTFGSLLAFPISYFVVGASMRSDFRININGYNPAELELLTTFAALGSVILLLFIIGTIFSSLYVKMTGRQDPKEVVIDEVVGQMLVIALSSFSIAFIHNAGFDLKLGSGVTDFCFLFLMPFVLFRVFDIFKPWPIDWVDENIHGGLGIMLDDVLAAIFASVMQYAIIFLVIG